MKITDEQIYEQATIHAIPMRLGDCMRVAEYAFEKGAKWAIEQMKNQWISVEDRLPDDKQDVWVCNVIKGWGPALFYYDENENLFIKDYWSQFEPENTTHWMVADVPDLPNKDTN